MTRTLAVLASALVLAGMAATALAATEMEQALTEGGKRMTSDEIAERLAGRTVTFESASSGARFLVYYDGANGTLLKPPGSDDVMEGFYAVDLADHICLGMRSDAPIRLRCVNVVLIDGMMHKFELDGSLRGRVIDEAEGNHV